MKKWNVDRVTVFLFIAVVSFLYDLTFYLGIRDTTRFPHPFVYFRSLGDIEYLRGFPWMLRQVMFLLVAGGLLGWAIGFVILKSGWLSRATIRFLSLGLWFPFIVIFAVPATFWIGIAAVILCTIYHYLGASSLLDIKGRDVLLYTARETTLQGLFISFIAQIWWQRGWRWIDFPWMQNLAMGLSVLTILVALLVIVNWIFKSSFQMMSDRTAVLYARQSKIAGWSSFAGVLTLTAVWLTVWQTFTVAFWNANLSFQTALNGVLELFSGGEVWGDIATSLTEIVAGMILGGLIANLTIRLMNRSAKIKHVLIQFLPASYVSPIVVWLLVILFIAWLDSNHAKIPSFFPGYGHTIMGVGLLTFLPLVQALWGLRHESSQYGMLVAIDHALPVAFIAMLFGELYTATAGIGFAMTVASATYQYQKGLAGFLTAVGLLVVLSSSLRLVAKRACPNGV